MPSSELYNYIHGQPMPSPSAPWFEVINPATGATAYRAQSADDALFEQAITSAQQGQAEWAAMPMVARSRIISRAAQLLREHNDALAAIEVEDTGKPWQEASVVDVATGADALEYFAHLGQSLRGDQQPVGDDFYYTRQEPLGVVAGIGAWNYPLQIACWKAAPALIAGNAMVFKASEETPRGAIKLAEIFTQAGVPNGVFNVIQGAADIGRRLTTDPRIAKVSFTGEVSTGKAVMRDAAGSLKSVTMELGGKSPLIIFDDADLEQAVSGAMLANFYTQGEVCTHGTRVYVHESLYPAFVEQLLHRIQHNVVVGDPMDPGTNIGALISKAHQDKVMSYIRQAQQDGAVLRCGGQTVHPEGFENGYYVAPTVFTDCRDDMQLCREEIFGPVMAVLTFNDEQDVIRRANDTDYGLAAGVFTRDIQRAHRVIHQLQAGICWINAYGNSPVEMPVGGYKQSGLGRENGVEALTAYTQTKSVYVGMQPIDSPF
ncbi:betaine-aldehyde dehydrogenase [Aestuariibacter halophilus]|uniref:Betaine-aldehyde dehydrogenase n=1 Tax=Fluctibacter halophilus TaxID=226011 RepID=A0ABS8GB11_9ALTE|nr:betaine-aldehyde dehydrogenase [Aestuariibacter halophilus]MCC2617777.1 betaine-aldehyde dehydrogenase [Aestuariibacter halophilus]